MDNGKTNWGALADELATETEAFVSKITQIAGAYHIGRAQILEDTAQILATLSVAVEIVEESDGQYKRADEADR